MPNSNHVTLGNLRICMAAHKFHLQQQIVGHGGAEICSCILLTDNQTVVTSGYDRTLQLWKVGYWLEQSRNASCNQITCSCAGTCLCTVRVYVRVYVSVYVYVYVCMCVCKCVCCASCVCLCIVAVRWSPRAGEDNCRAPVFRQISPRCAPARWELFFSRAYACPNLPL